MPILEVRHLRGILRGIVILSIASCAVVQPPSGGPEDKTPPYVLDVSPRPDSTGVARDTKIRLTFSEKLDRDSFKNIIQLYPPAEFDHIKVKGDGLEISFRELLPETTICFMLKAGFKDDHLVKSRKNYIFQFSTSDSIEKGEISGHILFKGKPDSTGVAKIFEIKTDTIIDVQKQLESRIAFSESDGGFYFRNLPTDNSKYLLWAFSDKDGNGSFSSSSEFSLLYADTIVLSERSSSADEVFINVIDPNEPGLIEGRVINETDFTQLPTVRLDPLLPAEKPIISLADSTGNYIIPRIRPGGYILSAFVDIEVDSLCGEYRAPEDSTLTLKEPCSVLPDTLIIRPGESRTLEPITIEKEEGI